MKKTLFTTLIKGFVLICFVGHNATLFCDEIADLANALSQLKEQRIFTGTPIIINLIGGKQYTYTIEVSDDKKVLRYNGKIIPNQTWSSFKNLDDAQKSALLSTGGYKFIRFISGSAPLEFIKLLPQGVTKGTGVQEVKGNDIKLDDGTIVKAGASLPIPAGKISVTLKEKKLRGTQPVLTEVTTKAYIPLIIMKAWKDGKAADWELIAKYEDTTHSAISIAGAEKLFKNLETTYNNYATWASQNPEAAQELEERLGIFEKASNK